MNRTKLKGSIRRLLTVAFALPLVMLWSAGERETRAASAVAFDGERSVYGYSYNFRSVREAREGAVRSCRRRGGRNCRIIVACPQDGYGMIYLRRHPEGRIRAIGAACGAPTWQQANSLAKRSCNARGVGRCGGPHGSWRDTARARARTAAARSGRKPHLRLPVRQIRWETTLVNTLAYGNAAVPGERFVFSCPANGYRMNVYGTDIYHISSSVCTAAVHRGLISVRRGGIVKIRIRRGSSVFRGSARNGVRSRTSHFPDPRWRLGFEFIG